MKDRCGFLFVRHKRQCCGQLGACSFKKRLLVGGWLNTSSIVISISSSASVHYREVVCSWEVPLYVIIVVVQFFLWFFCYFYGCYCNNKQHSSKSNTCRSCFCVQEVQSTLLKSTYTKLVYSHEF